MKKFALLIMAIFLLGGCAHYTDHRLLVEYDGLIYPPKKIHSSNPISAAEGDCWNAARDDIWWYGKIDFAEMFTSKLDRCFMVYGVHWNYAHENWVGHAEFWIYKPSGNIAPMGWSEFIHPGPTTILYSVDEYKCGTHEILPLSDYWKDRIISKANRERGEQINPLLLLDERPRTLMETLKVIKPFTPVGIEEFIKKTLLRK